MNGLWKDRSGRKKHHHPERGCSALTDGDDHIDLWAGMSWVKSAPLNYGPDGWTGREGEDEGEFLDI